MTSSDEYESQELEKTDITQLICGKSFASHLNLKQLYQACLSLPSSASIVNFLQENCRLFLEEKESDALPEETKVRYEIQKKIGSGGMGKVFLVEDYDLGRQVAMKIIDSDLAKKNIYNILEFIEEAQTIGHLEHPNIIPVYDIGILEEKGIYFTMKYIRGENLAQIIIRLKKGNKSTHATYTWTRRAQIVQAICDALDFAHKKGIIHRDLKPSNIMIGEFGEVYVMDWGVAKLVLQDGVKKLIKPLPSVDTDSSPGGNPLNITGTPLYMSPEQAEGRIKDLSAATDVYAIGGIIYELFGLDLAHNGRNREELFHAICNKKPKRLDKLKNSGQGTVPIEFHYITKKALAKKTKDRHSSVKEVKKEIQSFMNGQFPVVCFHTGLKRFIRSFERLLDNYPKPFILSILVIIVFSVVAYFVKA